MQVPAYRLLRGRTTAAAIAMVLAACGGGEPTEEPAFEPDLASSDQEGAREQPLSFTSGPGEWLTQ